jgi:hypothetical protein
MKMLKSNLFLTAELSLFYRHFKISVMSMDIFIKKSTVEKDNFPRFLLLILMINCYILPLASMLN